MLKNKFILLGLILTILLICFLFIVPFTNQEKYLIRLSEIDRCFKDGQIPCRWVLGLEDFYGSPIFNYHAPLPYYFGELIFFITNNLTITLKIIFAVSLIGSYIFMYLFAYKFLGKFRANSSAIFYTVLAFSAIILSNEGLGLAWGLMFFPLILLNLNLLSQKMKIQNFLFSSIFLSLLTLSADTAPIFLGLIFLWVGYQYIRKKSFTFLFLSLSSIIFAFLLSSFYIFPSVLERNLVHSVSMNDPLRFLPKSVAEKPQIVIDAKYQILTGDSDVSNFKQGTNWLRFETNTRTHTIIRLSQVYFPHWKIFIDGKEAQVEYKNNSLGLMTIILGEGSHIVEGRLLDTPIRAVSNIVTVVSVIVTLLLWIIQFKKVRNSLNYYKKRVN
ncbi:hypothetical protein HYS96_02250 [Candidatus Daviesbacteria bacterium]|nr:hypothetical protein [Candidatus Daviesbacteria bacterium]